MQRYFSNATNYFNDETTRPATGSRRRLSKWVNFRSLPAQTPCPLSPVSDQTADVAGGPVRATTGLMHRSKERLFNHFVGASEQRGRELHPELPCSFLVHDKLKFRGALDR
jgi:hypothetical protein